MKYLLTKQPRMNTVNQEIILDKDILILILSNKVYYE
jgi:hypothetical protein